MASNAQAGTVSKGALWTGWILTILPVLLLIFSAIMKFAKPPPVVQGFEHMGLSLSLAVPLGVVELVCALIYVFPRTSVLGAILLTGYLGGATCATLRVGDSFIPPVIVGVLIWGGLFLRDPRIRALIPLRSDY